LLRLITTWSGNTRSPYRSRCSAFQSFSRYFSRIGVDGVAGGGDHGLERLLPSHGL